METLYLASSSPRRRTLLARSGYPFKVVFPQAEEQNLPLKVPKGMIPTEILRRAKTKAFIVAKKVQGIILTADTVVAFRGRIHGKPKSLRDAFHTLSVLQGKTHVVYTGVVILDACSNPAQMVCGIEKTKVRFHPMSKNDILWYLRTGEPYDKAGSYGIQGKGKRFVKQVEGCYDNVVGLPVAKVKELIGRLKSVSRLKP